MDISIDKPPRLSKRVSTPTETVTLSKAEYDALIYRLATAEADLRHAQKLLAQVTFPEGLTIDSTQEKFKYDLYYIKNIGFMLDLAILLKTLRSVISGKGH